MNLESLTNMSRMDVLRSLGLAPRFSDMLLPALGIFAAGAMIGAGTALMLAPRSGQRLRRQIRDEMRSKIGELEQLLEGDDFGKKREREQSKGREQQERSADKKAA
jgi:hypothetical protein